jgi:WD repeat-containing protein 19
MIDDDTEQIRRFPHNKQQEVPVVNVEIAGDFMILVDAQGKLKYYLIEDNATVCEFKSENPIVKIFPNASGTKCICIDNTGNGFLFSPVDDSSIFIPNFSPTTYNILWDIDDP